MIITILMTIKSMGFVLVKPKPNLVANVIITGALTSQSYHPPPPPRGEMFGGLNFVI